MQIEPFLLKVERINSISLTVPPLLNNTGFPNWEEIRCEWNKHFQRLCTHEVFSSEFEKSLNDHWQPYGCLHWAVWLSDTSECFRNLQGSLLVWWALDAQLTFGSKALCQGNKDSRKWPCPHISSIHSLSPGSAWEKWTLDGALPRSLWETSSGVFPVWVQLWELWRTLWLSLCFIYSVYAVEHQIFI